MSCSKQPTACFDVDPSTAQVGETINLDATCSTEAEEYRWSAEGDAIFGTMTSQTTVEFSTPGTYGVTLEVVNGKKTDEMTYSVTVQ